ncbi:hypothetical protein [Kineosporia sp. R_H_3]|uniref:hypothetical protein n=1 Tax=Kineosporia sp. R_H_3 TaxID=1961848 RepID=UPI000B4A8E22|nr:hypothetical protein [Kineosporia sp. R_H_3]
MTNATVVAAARELTHHIPANLPVWATAGTVAIMALLELVLWYWFLGRMLAKVPSATLSEVAQVIDASNRRKPTTSATATEQGKPDEMPPRQKEAEQGGHRKKKYKKGKKRPHKIKR